jgi:colicin import membrane protein
MTQSLRTAEPSTALAEIERIALPATFATAEVTDVLDKIKAAVAERAPDLDISTAKGRREIASLARRIASTKVVLDDHGKALVTDIKARAGLIDEERRRVRTELDLLRDQVRAPLDAFEEAERVRVAGHEAELIRIAALGRLVPSATVEMIQDRLDQIEALPARDWREFAERASKKISIALEDLREQLRWRQEADAQAAEVERLRQEHEAQIAAVAAENARREAEDLARVQAAAEAARVEAAARERIAAERAEEERLRGHRHAMESVRSMITDALSPFNGSAVIRRIDNMIDTMAELQFDYQEFQADFDAMLAAGRTRIAERLAEVEKSEAEQAESLRRDQAEAADLARVRAQEQAARDQAAAIEAERQRVAKIAEQEESAKKRREEDVENKKAVNRKARDAVVKIIGIQVAIGAENDKVLATAIVTAIARGEIPHVKIEY